MNKQKETTSDKVVNLVTIIGIVVAVVGVILTFSQNYGWGIPMILIGAAVFFIALYADNVGWTRVFAKPFVLLDWFPVATPLITLIVCATVLGTLALTKSMNSPFMWVFLLGFVVSGVHTVIAVAKWMSRVRDEKYDEVEDDRSDYERFVDEKLPHILIDYYSPVSEFPIERPLRSEFSSVEEHKAALAELEAQRHEDRLENAKTYIGEAWEETDGVLEVTLTTKERTTDEDLVKRLPMVSSALGAYGARVDNNPERPNGHVVVFIDMERQPSTLEKLTPKLDARAFFEENPPQNQDSLPLAIASDGRVFSLPVHHMICTGRTGSGKGSVLQTIIYQLLPFVAEGTARIWFVDPKPAEVLRYVGKSALHRYAIEDEEIVALISEFEADMNAQKQRADLGRSNVATVDNPVNYLIIDEIADLLDNPAIAKAKDENGKSIADSLKSITRKGRSLNFFLDAFTQEITADPMGSLPKNMPVKMVGYVESGYETAKALGVKEAQLEHYPELIFPLPESTKANGMKYSGIFNVKMDGERIAIRVPYVSEDMIDERIAEFGLDAAPTDHPRTYNITVHKISAGSKAEGMKMMEAMKAQQESLKPVSATELADVFAAFDED